MEAQQDAWNAYESRDFATAERIWIKLLDEAESDEERHSHVVGFGYVLVAQKRFNEARYLFRRLITEDGNEHVFWHQLAYVEREAGNLDESLRLIEKEAELLDAACAVASCPHLPRAVNAYEQGFLRLLMGRLDEAEEWAERCIDLSLKTSDFVAHGCAFRLLGDLCARRFYEADISLGAVGPLYTAREAYARSLSAFDRAGDLIGTREVRARIADLA
jgi:tetratricopeptide (TPR) repeat protein